MTTADDSTARSGDLRSARKSRAPQTARDEEMRDRRRRERAEAKRQTRNALLEAGLDEIIERGLDAGLDGICARAGYTRGAFYVHFKDREDFLLAITEWVVGSIVDSLIGGEHAREDLPTTIERFFRILGSGTWPLMPRARIAALRLMDAIDRWPALQKSFDRLIGKAIEQLTHSVSEGQDRDRIRSDIDPNKLGTMLVVMAVGMIMLHNVGIAMDFDRQQSALLRMIRGDPTSA